MARLEETSGRFEVATLTVDALRRRSLRLFQIVQIGNTEATFDNINVELDVIFEVIGGNLQQVASELRPGGTTQSGPAPDFSNSVPSLVPCADQFGNPWVKAQVFPEKGLDLTRSFYRKSLVEIGQKFMVGRCR
ncbi:hypothetical protein SH668x_002243 [Planctomicrobium sp. SH668]|uniref:hypothetical protein n=1 Tax=Planctomicrobium sp. SH668 TaxID=3448126 RepID=UPI003F5B465A